MKEYRLGEWVDDENPKEEAKPPIQRIAKDISIIRAWVQFFGIITVAGWVVGFLYLLALWGN